MKYEKMIKRNLMREQVDGATLGSVDGADLKICGIAKFNDFKNLLHQIQLLVSTES